MFGEESNQFENKLGENITVTVGSDPAQTLQMIERILNGDVQFAQELTDIIHSTEFDYSQLDTDQLVNLSVPADDIALWIDPIDSTSEYINGKPPTNTDLNHEYLKVANGLHCVTCLFGVFQISTGVPIVGVLNQPFYKFNASALSFQGRFLWGVALDNRLHNNIHTETIPSTQIEDDRLYILVGNKESETILRQLRTISTTHYVSGAGHKLLCVATGKAHLLVTSSPSTYYWDTCAGHAILRSLGGGLLSLQDSLKLHPDTIGDQQLQRAQIKYQVKSNEDHRLSGYNNGHGLVAYVQVQSLKRALVALQTTDIIK